MHCTCIYMLMLIYMPYALACYLNIHTHINTPLIAHCRGQYIDYWRSLRTKYCKRNGIQPSKVGVVGTWTWFDLEVRRQNLDFCSVPIGFATAHSCGFHTTLGGGASCETSTPTGAELRWCLVPGSKLQAEGRGLEMGCQHCNMGSCDMEGIGRFNLRSYNLIDGRHIRNAIGPRKYNII